MLWDSLKFPLFPPMIFKVCANVLSGAAAAWQEMSGQFSRFANGIVASQMKVRGS
jgi:hypothetical protein